jgi:acetyltransferase-like isoleucine patch superfamily enzyme
MNIHNILQAIVRGPELVNRVKDKTDRSFFSLYGEMIGLCIRYNLTGPDYVKYGVYALTGDNKEMVKKLLQDKVDYVKKRDKNWQFLIKYADIRYQKNAKWKSRRRRAYTKRYHMGDRCHVQYGVMFIFEHRRIGKLSIGSDCLFARNVDVDITGDLTIGNLVKISEGVKILTHNHDSFGTYADGDLIPFSNRAHNTPLTIADNVVIGSHAIIMPNVKSIGENSIISAGSVVTHPVPANCIVAGNPAAVISKFPKSLRVDSQRFYDDAFSIQINLQGKTEVEGHNKEGKE